MEKMNKPTRLRTLIVGHLKEINPNVTLGQIDNIESDIKTFVKSVLHGTKELGLEVDCESFIGDLD